MLLQNYLIIIHQFLSRVSRIRLILSSLILLSILTCLDYFTGIEFGFTIFYLFVVLLLTWFVNLYTGIIFSFLSILSWFIIRLILLSQNGIVKVDMFNLLGDSSIRLLFLFTCSYVLSLLKIDMAVRAEQTKELIELNKMKNFFIGMVAHDLRNPLSIIEMSSFNLLEDDKRKNWSQDQTILLESIYRKSVFMLNMIEEYLDVAKIESGHLQINRNIFNYERFINDIVALNAIIANQKNIHIEICKETEIPSISFDRNKISQVVNNLLINAINYSNPDSIIKINLRVVTSFKSEDVIDKNIVTEIVDNGPGIDAEDFDRLFEAFYRSKTSNVRGTGLGLTISKKIVEAHGGAIGFKNNIKTGSTFWFSLPFNNNPQH